MRAVVLQRREQLSLPEEGRILYRGDSKCHGRSFGIKHIYVLILTLLRASSMTLNELLKSLKLGSVAVKMRILLAGISVKVKRDGAYISCSINFKQVRAFTLGHEGEGSLQVWSLACLCKWKNMWLVCWPRLIWGRLPCIPPFLRTFLRNFGERSVDPRLSLIPLSCKLTTGESISRVTNSTCFPPSHSFTYFIHWTPSTIRRCIHGWI